MLVGALQTVYAHGQEASLREYLTSQGVQGQLPTASEVASGSLRFPPGSGKAPLLQALPGWLRQRLEAVSAQIPVNEILLEDVPFIDDPKLHDEIAYNQMLSLAAALEEGAVEARQAGDTRLAAERLRHAAEVLRRAAGHWKQGTPQADALGQRADGASAVAASLLSAGSGAAPTGRQREGSPSDRQAFELGQHQADKLRDFVVRVQQRSWWHGLD